MGKKNDIAPYDEEAQTEASQLRNNNQLYILDSQIQNKNLVEVKQ